MGGNFPKSEVENGRNETAARPLRRSRQVLDVAEHVERMEDAFLFGAISSRILGDTSLQHAIGDNLAVSYAAELKEILASAPNARIQRQVRHTMRKRRTQKDWRRAAEDFVLTLLSASLVRHCTMFEGFLVHVAQTLYVRQATKCRMDRQSDPGPAMKQFSKMPFPRKWDYLGEWFGLRTKSFFDWSWVPTQVQAKVENLAWRHLEDCFERRNNFLHRGIPLYGPGGGLGLNRDSVFFRMVLVGMAREVCRVYGVRAAYPATMELPPVTLEDHRFVLVLGRTL